MTSLCQDWKLKKDIKCPSVAFSNVRDTQVYVKGRDENQQWRGPEVSLMHLSVADEKQDGFKMAAKK